MLTNLTESEQFVLQNIATTDLLDEIIERCNMSNAREFFSSKHVEELFKILKEE
jgi:hypothetical protein